MANSGRLLDVSSEGAMRLLCPLFLTVILVPIASGQNWSPWRPDSVFNGVEVRERCTGYNEFAGRYLWDVQLRNRYRKSVDLSWAAEPQRLHGAQAQAARAFAVAPGETMDAHHTVPFDCSAGLSVQVSALNGAGGPRALAAPPLPQSA